MLRNQRDVRQAQILSTTYPIVSAVDTFHCTIANTDQAKVHTMLVIGNRDLEAGNVSVRLHGKGHVGAKPKGEVVADILAAVRERRT